MTPAEAHELLDVKPFRPFLVEMKDGRTFPVTRRNDAQAFRSHLLVTVDHDPVTEIAESVEFLGYDYIKALTPHEPQLAA